MVIKVLWYVTMLSLNLWCLYFCLGPAVVEKNWTSLFKSLGQFTYLNHINHTIYQFRALIKILTGFSFSSATKA